MFRVDFTGTQWSTNQDSKTSLLWASESKDPPSVGASECRDMLPFGIGVQRHAFFAHLRNAYNPIGLTTDREESILLETNREAALQSISSSQRDQL